MLLTGLMHYAQNNVQTVVLILFFFLLVVILLAKKAKSLADEKAQTYITEFEIAYRKDQDVVYALEKAKALFPEKSKEAKAISQAILHINKSILHDYATAFGIIDKVIRGKDVKSLHEKILNNEKEKRKTLLLLCSKKSTTLT